MSSDSSSFACLPLAVRDSILQQAFQQLDQRHLCGVAPRVCRLFRQLSLSISTSLDVTIRTEAAAEGFSSWMQDHGAGLDSLVLKVREPGRIVLQSLTAAEQLCSLTLSARMLGTRSLSLDAPLHVLTNLTRLSIDSFSPTAPVLDSILGLTRLDSLTLNWWRPRYRDTSMASFMEKIARRLVGLTWLDLSHSCVEVTSLVHLCNLPNLKELLVSEVIPAVNLPELDALPILSLKLKVEEATLSHFSAWLQGNSVSHLQELYIRPRIIGSILDVPNLPLHRAPQLMLLHISHVELDLVLPSSITQLTQLTSLHLIDCELDDADVFELSGLSNLLKLDLSKNSEILGAQGSMDVLARSMPSLRVLCLAETSAQEAAQTAFGKRVRLYRPEFGIIHLQGRHGR